MKLLILGCGEAFDSGYGNNSCLLSGKGLPTVLFDCGYQIPERLWHMARDLYSEMDAIYLTHLHADHSFGLPSVLSRYWEENRKKPLKIIGPPGVDRFVNKLFDMAYPGLRRMCRFPIHFEALRPGQKTSFRGLVFQTARSSHPVMNLSVRVTLSNGSTFGISGDGSMTPATRKLFSKVDVLLQESWGDRSGAPVHSCLKEIQEFLETAEVGALGLTHLSRVHRKKIEAGLKKIQKKDPRWFLVQPGQEISW